MNKILKEKISESVSSVLPITIIVLLLSVTITPMPVGTMVLFLTGAALLIVGMALFSLGTDVSMTPMGEGIGAQLPRTKNLFIAHHRHTHHDRGAGSAGSGRSGAVHSK